MRWLGKIETAGGYRPCLRQPSERGRKAGFWTPERNAKLCYVMQKYNDLAKAARVLGVSERLCYRQWVYALKRGQGE